MMTTRAPQRTVTSARKRRAGISLLGIALAVAIIVALSAAMVIAHVTTAHRAVAGESSRATTNVARPNAAYPDAASDEAALATRPMLDLPAQAAQPQTLTTAVAGQPVTIPAARVAAGMWIPHEFPPTPEGALAQLKALDETVLTAADPAVYARGYHELTEQAAPDANGSTWMRLLTAFRSRAQLPATGAVPGMTASYEVTQGQIKGVTTNGSYTVVCVLGQFSIDYKGQILSVGVGDCQAMRLVAQRWRIAAGPRAADAPCAWPGSADAVKAGYRDLKELS